MKLVLNLCPQFVNVLLSLCETIGHEIAESCLYVCIVSVRLQLC